MKNLDETIAYENALDSYFSMLCSASRQHLFNKSKSINEIMFNNKIETDFESLIMNLFMNLNLNTHLLKLLIIILI